MKAVIYITNSEVTLPQNVERAIVIDTADEAGVRKALDFMMFGLPKSVTEMPARPPGSFVPAPDPDAPGPNEVEQARTNPSAIIAVGSDKVRAR